MSWYLPVQQYLDEATGTTWRVRRAWFDRRPGDYVLEVLSQGRDRPSVGPICVTGALNSCRRTILNCRPCVPKHSRAN
ncbi:hypothetical protein C8D78_3364 [Arthrobacter oryzae]|uniref:Uncharacterized protein n=1 Tax=Arthrobacter oryzae TaxID=409290 RepID=A0A495EA87_9MICC|nr:hypothetical protein C8D78_3364 [Arthrobacter oryzae]